MRRGLSPLISAVLLMAITFAIATVVSPWAFQLANDATNQTSTQVTEQITCQSAAYDFDTGFAVSGVNASTATDTVEAKIVNTGTVNLHSFSFEVEVNTGSGLILRQYAVNSTYQKTKALPLKPGQSAIIKANITEDLNGTFTEVKILNGVCPSDFIKLDL